MRLLMNTYQPQLIKSLHIVKPNFHAFTARFHAKLEESNITMQYPSAAYFNEKSYILYCVLERIVRHLDNPSSVAPFLTFHLQYLKKMGVTPKEISLLCDAFYDTLNEHLGRLFTSQTQFAWQKALRYFESFANTTLFNKTNVISLEQKITQLRTSKL